MNRTFVAADGSVAVEIEDSASDTMLGAVRRAGLQETGGILIGRYAPFGDRVIVAEATLAPPDSTASPTAFTRGVVGLTHRLRLAWTRGVYYVGEWHSHPRGLAEPSMQDLAQIVAFARDPAYRCTHPVLVIVGGDLITKPRTTVHAVLAHAVVACLPMDGTTERAATSGDGHRAAPCAGNDRQPFAASLPPARPGEPIRGRRHSVPRDEVDIGESDVALDHVQRRVAEDPLEAEHIAPVDEVAPGEGVAERVRAEPARHADPGLEPPE